jgi:hypothetical protein
MGVWVLASRKGVEGLFGNVESGFIHLTDSLP